VVKDYLFLKMNLLNIKDNGTTENHQELELKFFRMAILIRETFIMVLSTDKVSLNGMMVEYTLVLLLMDICMEKVNL